MILYNALHSVSETKLRVVGLYILRLRFSPGADGTSRLALQKRQNLHTHTSIHINVYIYSHFIRKNERGRFIYIYSISRTHRYNDGPRGIDSDIGRAFCFTYS